MGIDYEGEIVQKDGKNQIKRLKALLSAKDAEIADLHSVIVGRDVLINGLQDKIKELNGTNKYYKDRLSTAHQKLREKKGD